MRVLGGVLLLQQGGGDPGRGSANGSAFCSPGLGVAWLCSVLLPLTCADKRRGWWGTGGDSPYKRGVAGSKPAAPTRKTRSVGRSGPMRTQFKII
jgi:hypothetical protein